jgi:hypothetical protein
LINQIALLIKRKEEATAQFESRIKNQLQIKQNELKNADERLKFMKRELRGLQTGD